MDIVKAPEGTAASLMALPGDFNCYEYFLKNTAAFGDYHVFEHYGKKHLRSDFIRDIEALSVFFSEKLGLKSGDAFTIFMPTNAESMITFMALNKIGVIVSFVHPLLPPDNLKELMDETKTKGIMLLDMFARGYAAVIGAQNIPCVVCVPSTYAVPDMSMAKAAPEAMEAVSASVKEFYTYPEIVTEYAGKTVDMGKGSKDAVAVYMSGGGTTGKSKTIKLTNFALTNVIYGTCSTNTPTVNRGIDTEICAMPFFHAFGFCAGGLTTVNKGALAIYMPKFDSDKFIEIMKTHPVVEFNGVPNMYKKLLDNPEFDGPHLKTVHVMYSGGDDLRPAFLERFRQVMRKNGSNADICQGYGLTECCAVCTNNTHWANKPGSIGKPIPGLTIKIWDDDNKELPIGETGQIVMRGPTMMQGYLTSEGAEDDGLYADENGDKWVLTGDLGYCDEDGFFFFVGRKKRVIIISGYNVYPADIEKLLQDMPQIKESCAVQGVIDDKPIVRLYVVKNEGEDEEAIKNAIISICSEKLSKFSVPRDIQFIDALPRTRIEKVDFMKLTEKLMAVKK